MPNPLLTFLTTPDYGPKIAGLKIDGRPANYGVVNEHQVRAAAGLMFTIGLSTFFLVLGLGFRELLLPVVSIFWLDFALKVFVGPQASFFGKLTGWLVKHKPPQYVGAIQKRFAWLIGLIMASLMIFFTQIVNTGPTIPILICGICLTFMWLESAVGFCAGCYLFKQFRKVGILPNDPAGPKCADGACEL